MTKTDTATYRELVESARRLEDKIDVLSLEISRNYVKKDDIKDDIMNLKKDVEALKNWRYYFTGFAAAIGSIAGVIISKIKI